MRKNIFRSLFAMVMVVSILSASYATALAASPTQIEPRYTGIFGLTSGLKISSNGAASCSGTAVVQSGYTADLTVELKRDGTTIRTWTDSGSGALSAGGTYFVTPGHDYVVTTTVDVYEGDSLIESPSKDSPESSY